MYIFLMYILQVILHVAYEMTSVMISTKRSVCDALFIMSVMLNNMTAYSFIINNFRLSINSQCAAICVVKVFLQQCHNAAVLET
jgi:hypothetical protein